jgi:restriction endonuclease-like protein
MTKRPLDQEIEERAVAALLPHLPIAAILERYRRAKRNEIASGKLASLESSAALAANTFGFFINRPADLPPLPGWENPWRPASVLPEAEVRFPWRGGLHPWLDALIETDEFLIGVESKRYEPFRTRANDGKPPFSDAYWRDKFGQRMGPYQWLRDGLGNRPSLFKRLDAVQLVKHAFGLRTQAHARGKAPVLAYAYAEPKAWPPPTVNPISDDARTQHAEEVRWFARMVGGAEVRFMSFTYVELLATFASAPSQGVRDHAKLVCGRFDC